MSMVDINYGMGSYRAMSGGNRAEKQAERRTGARTGEAKDSGAGRSTEACKESVKSGEGGFVRRMAEKQTAAVFGGKAAKGERAVSGREASEREKVPASGERAVEREKALAFGGVASKREEQPGSSAGAVEREEQPGSSAGTVKGEEQSGSSAGAVKREEQSASAAGAAEREEQPGPAAGAAEGEKAGSAWWEATAGQAAKSPSDMSLQEYMNYIYGIISELSRRNYSRGNSVFIYISEEGFRAMQNDPEYEAWVMDNIRQAYHYCGSRGGHDGYHSAHFFGATREEYQGQSWHSGCSKCEQERRRERKLRQKKKLEALLKKRRERKLLEQRRLAKLRLEKAFYKKLLAKRRLDRERLEAEFQEDAFARKKLEEGYREEALARREAASAFRMYQAIARYTEQ